MFDILTVGEFLSTVEPPHQSLEHGTVVFIIFWRSEQVAGRSAINTCVNAFLLLLALFS